MTSNELLVLAPENQPTLASAVPLLLNAVVRTRDGDKTKSTRLDGLGMARGALKTRMSNRPCD